MKLKNIHIGVLIVLIMVGGIGIFMGFNLWSTESEKIPAKLSEGEAAGSYDPFDIRGSYTFGEISSLFEIDMSLLTEAFQLGDAAEAVEKQTKDLETLYGELPGEIEIGNESVQVFVAVMKGLDLNGADAYLPLSAVNVLLVSNPELSEDMLAYLDRHQVDVTINADSNEVIDSNTSDGETESKSEDDSEEANVNGNTTFSEVIGFGVTKEQIETIIDADMPPENQTVKSYCTDNSLSFSEVKEALNALITP